MAQDWNDPLGDVFGVEGTVFAQLCTTEYIAERVIPILSHKATLKKMSDAAKSTGIRDAAERLRDMLYAAVDTGSDD